VAVSIVELDESRLDEAAALLASRHGLHRAAEPLLPPAPAGDAGAAAALRDAFERPTRVGVAALDGGRLAAYALADWQADTLRGRSAWIRAPGWAGETRHAGVLYAALAERLLAVGCFEHLVLVPALSALVDPWLELGFAHQQTHALRPLGATDRPGLLPADVSIRIARPDDLDPLAAMGDLVGEHQARAPVYAPLLPEWTLERRAGYAELLADAVSTIFLAERAGVLLGFQIHVATDSRPGDLMTPRGCTELVLAATAPEARGTGVGRALTAHALAWAHEQGFTTCETDWRTANLLAAPFWRASGFRPTFYRLSRTIDPRALWAR
jgi:GNAT superfamily N-acetyltransferase